MKFIHIADVHLGATPDAAFSWGKEREREIWSSFYRIIDICNEEQVDLLLIAGDLFHKQPLVRQLKEINYAFGKLKRTRVFLMAGNHDFLSSTSNYKGFEWDPKVHMFYGGVLEAVPLPEQDTFVYGLSYLNRDVIEPLYDSAKPCDATGYHILLAHGGDEKNIPINHRRLQTSGFDYIALGHIHKPELYGNHMAYAGSLEPLDKNEIGDHGYIFGELHKDTHGKTVTKASFVPFSSRQYKRVRLSVNRDTTNGSLLDQVSECIRREGPQHIYSFLIQGFRDEVIHFDKEALRNLGNVMEVDDRSVPDYDLVKLYQQNEDNILGLLIKRIGIPVSLTEYKQEAATFPEHSRSISREEEVAKKALYYGLEALLNSRD